MSNYSYLPEDWKDALSRRGIGAYEASMAQLEDAEMRGAQIVPKRENLFKAFHLTPINEVKCVILGIAPYTRGPDVADGLAYSAANADRMPHTLHSILTELRSDLGHPIPETGDLSKWAKQGVLLLNTSLTAEVGDSYAHEKWRWRTLAVEVLNACERSGRPIVYNIWGTILLRLAESAGLNRFAPNAVITSNPSPNSSRRGFFKSKPFSTTNEILVSMGSEPIDWNLNQ